MAILSKYQKKAEELQDNYTTVGCAFEPVHNESRLYTFKMPKCMLEKLRLNDEFLVSANNRFAVVVIKRIDDHPLNPMNIKLSWVVQKISTRDYDELNQQDRNLAIELAKEDII